ncbi:hypothetical protein [Vibrio europaeus]|uniref:hypothetical protein n=1 Tax=Vibrio europaeus TaxID=300876 RepID=UPI00233EE777|nr:hypothetical protein [Vibrio europaeus]MDC5753592.1 hypothetical protein [Vibrio europaeus]MDC5816495.1 hypothetical protein [Vibrio europaeus]
MKKSLISSIIFHWSESVAVSKIINPNWQITDDVQHKVTYTQAREIISLALDELKKEERYCFKTAMTLIFEDGYEYTFTMDVRENEKTIRDAIKMRTEDIKAARSGEVSRRVLDRQHWNFLETFSSRYQLREAA